jgi:CubicO group peptidase (beta-lactamase class C family)
MNIYTSRNICLEKGFITTLLVILMSFSLNTSAQILIKPIASLNEYYAKALTDWQVPGMAIAIVRNDTILLSKGYGVLEVNKPEKVNDKTLFAIASNTKAFTAAALAILVDEGKIRWDDQVIKYIPWFQLYDPFVTQNMKIRDLLSHRSGLETFSGDLLWFGSNYSRDEVIRRARFLKPKYGFREHFGYSNIMFLTAGEIVHAVTGISWDQFLSDRIFKPLGMVRTNTSIKALKGMTNVAACHTDSSEKVISIPYLDWDNIGPAGSINSCVNDLTKWLKLQLNNGTFDNKVIFSKATNREMWSPQTIQTISAGAAKMFPSTHFKAYAFGWGVNDYLGYQIVSHSGGYDGMTSYTCLVPEKKLGFVILTNKNSSLFLPLVYRTLDALLGGKETDWSAMFLDNTKKGAENTALQKKEEEKARALNTKPSLDLSAYSGKYDGELYGAATVELKNGELVLTFVPSPKFTSTLKHWHYDTFTVQFKQFPSLPEGKVNFVINAAGKVEEMRVNVPNPDFDFTELKFKKIQ